MKKLSKNIIYTRLNVALTIVLVAGIALLFVLPNRDGLSNQNNGGESNSRITGGKSIELPIPLSNKYVTSALLLYFFEAPVKEYVKIDEGYKLTLGASKKDIPSFIITDKATILRLSEDSTQKVGGVPQTAQSQMEDIKEGQIVQVGANYDLRRKQWNVAGVTILSK